MPLQPDPLPISTAPMGPATAVPSVFRRLVLRVVRAYRHRVVVTRRVVVGVVVGGVAAAAAVGAVVGIVVARLLLPRQRGGEDFRRALRLPPVPALSVAPAPLA